MRAALSGRVAAARSFPRTRRDIAVTSHVPISQPCYSPTPAPAPAPALVATQHAIDAVLAYLRCPTCAQPLHRCDRRIVCPAGHSFDLARQGYLNLTVGGVRHGSADTSAMVRAREHFLSHGHFRPIAEQVAMIAARYDPTPLQGIAVDLAGGTGYYLRALLDRLPDRFGLCLDLSAPALRRSARTHLRAAAVGADAWQRLPLTTGSASTVLSVFGPRNTSEIERVLAPDGVLIVVSPTAAHLSELIRPLGMLRVDPDKQRRLAAALNRFRIIEQRTLTYRQHLDRQDAACAAAMGPAAMHAPAGAFAARARALPDRIPVTIGVHITAYVASHRDPECAAETGFRCPLSKVGTGSD